MEVECKKIEVDVHRWYVILAFTLPDDTVREMVISSGEGDGIMTFKSYEEYERDS